MVLLPNKNLSISKKNNNVGYLRDAHPLTKPLIPSPNEYIIEISPQRGDKFGNHLPNIFSLDNQMMMYPTTG